MCLQSQETQTVKKMSDNKNSDYDIVAKRDGEYCKLCGVTAAERKLVASNKISDVNDTEPKDKILCCTNCMIDKKLYELCVHEREKVHEDVGYVSELQVNRQKEMRFRLYVFEKLSESKNREWNERDLISAGAEVIGISTTTARRYLDKMCCSAGVLVRHDDGNNVYVAFDLDDWRC